MNTSLRRRACGCAVALLAAHTVGAQEAPPPSPAATPPLPAFIAEAYRPRETDPAAVARGRELFTVSGCAFCHGSDARGGSGGPSLLRSQLVQRDQAGETIAAVVTNGVPNTAMVGFPLQPDQIRDIAEFLHSFKLDSRDPARNRPETIVTGKPRAGRRYFAAHCADCHSAEGDLRGLAGKYPVPRTLQQTWLMPRSKAPTTARVSQASGVVEGELERIDEFIVSLRLADGSVRTFIRNGAEPRVEIFDPLAGHKALLPVYTDPDIHNVTAYLLELQ